MSDYPIVKKRRGEFFPHGGGRRSETYVNDVEDPDNIRRLRINPLKDGYDSQENPVREDGPSPKKPDIPLD